VAETTPLEWSRRVCGGFDEYIQANAGALAPLPLVAYPNETFKTEGLVEWIRFWIQGSPDPSERLSWSTERDHYIESGLLRVEVNVRTGIGTKRAYQLASLCREWMRHPNRVNMILTGVTQVQQDPADDESFQLSVECNFRYLSDVAA
jgi:hypothetical protein